MNDYLVIGIDKKENFRAYAAVTTGLAEEAHRRHDTSATASAALGRALTAGVLMSGQTLWNCNENRWPSNAAALRKNWRKFSSAWANGARYHFHPHALFAQK